VSQVGREDRIADNSGNVAAKSGEVLADFEGVWLPGNFPLTSSHDEKFAANWYFF